MKTFQNGFLQFFLMNAKIWKFIVKHHVNVQSLSYSILCDKIILPTNIYINVIIDFSIKLGIPIISSKSKELFSLLWKFLRCFHMIILQKRRKGAEISQIIEA